MRASGVRSNTAPHASSARTRSGASLACSSAIRQLLTYWPPRIVSAKCTFQLSRSSTLASAAATPPSAMTVCALPSSDLQINPTFTPPADASIAARSPAPPAPMTRTSYSCVSGVCMVYKVRWDSTSVASENPEIGPDAHRTEPHVDIRECDREQAAPGKELMPPVETGDARVA